LKLAVVTPVEPVVVNGGGLTVGGGVVDVPGGWAVGEVEVEGTDEVGEALPGPVVVVPGFPAQDDIMTAHSTDKANTKALRMFDERAVLRLPFL
jgi:hypothetical protein